MSVLITAKRVYAFLRRIPIVGLLVTAIVRIVKAPFPSRPPVPEDFADELHVVTASVHVLRAEVEGLANSLTALRAELGHGGGAPAPGPWRDQPLPLDMTAMLAGDAETPPQQIALDMRGDDRSSLIAQIETCAPATISAATIPLSGSETPEALRDLAQALAKAMRVRAILCLRLLDRLSLFLAGSRDGTDQGTALQLSPELVLDVFERHGCRLIGLRRGTAGQCPTVDLIIEMRES